VGALVGDRQEDDVALLVVRIEALPQPA
jgi:hypothetical protein